MLKCKHSYGSSVHLNVLFHFFVKTLFRTFLRCKTHYYKIRTNRKPKNSVYLQKLSYLNHNLSVFRLLKFNFVIISYLMAMLICFLYFQLNFVFHRNYVNWFFDQRGDSQSKIPLRCFETKKFDQLNNDGVPS